MTSDGPRFSGLATASPHEKLHAFFGIDIGLQQRVGAFVVLFSMIEQQLEFVLLTRSKPPSADGILPTDRMTVSDRLSALRALAPSEPSLATDIELIADVGEALMTARHTIAHGAPLEHGRMERNRSWFGEQRKRPFAALQMGEPVLDAAVTASEILFRLLGSIGASLSGQHDVAAVMAPSAEDKNIASSAVGMIGQAMDNLRSD